VWRLTGALLTGGDLDMAFTERGDSSVLAFALANFAAR
jgi:hypothetical protein